MNENILREGKKYLVSYVKDKTVDYETYHPWRKSWEFVVLHSLRVEGYVYKILEREAHSLSEDEVLITRLAAILHDIGRIHRRENHALIGRDIIHKWLQENKMIANSIHDKNKLLYLIEKHSNKEDDEGDYCLKVIQDADLLDEIGVMSIFMASNWVDKGNPYFFKLLCDRIETYEVDFCKETFKLLKTQGAKVILEEKLEFIESFVEQFKDELYGTEMFGDISIEDYFKEMIR